MDDLDRAQEIMERQQVEALKARRPEGPKATGECLYCGEEIEGRWCDAYCRDEWERDMKRALIK